MLRFELRTRLDPQVLTDVLRLIEEVTRMQGRPPLGEHKQAHLTEGGRDWTGVMAYDEGRLIGYAHLRWNAAGDRPRAAVEVVAHPERDGRVAQRLLDEAQAAVAAAGGGLLYLWEHGVTDVARTLGAEAGFEIQRELAFMARELRTPPEGINPPDGVVLRSFRPGFDDEPFLEVNNAAFAGHPEQGGWDLAEFQRRQARDWFDPAGLLLAWRDDDLMGFHWTKRHAHDAESPPPHGPVGEVYVLGVHPRARRLGLGRALLAAGLAHLWERGCRSAILYVDSGSGAAVRLYESAGFSVVSKEVCHQRLVASGPAEPSDGLLRPVF